MKSVEFDIASKEEMMEASRFYEARQRKLGVSFLREVEKAVRRVRRFPQSGFTVSSNIRRMLVKRFPYAILYSNQPNKIYIVAVMHTRRKPDYWKARVSQ